MKSPALVKQYLEAQTIVATAMRDLLDCPAVLPMASGEIAVAILKLRDANKEIAQSIIDIGE